MDVNKIELAAAVADATAATEKNENKMVKFDVTINNISELDISNPKTIYVCGYPWKVSFRKTADGLYFHLQSFMDDEYRRIVLVAEASVKLFSSIVEKESFKKYIELTYFTPRLAGKMVKLIPWDQLIDPDNGFVLNDTSVFQIKIKANKLDDMTKDDLIKCEILKKCCNDTSYGKFRLIIYKISEFNNVCSPEFTLESLPLRILIAKVKNYTNNENNAVVRVQSFLQFQLFTFLPAHGFWSFRTTMSCRLISFNPKIPAIMAQIQDQEFTFNLKSVNLNLVPWTTLLNPKTRYIGNDSIMVEVEVRIELAEGFRRPTPKLVDREIGEMRCPICFQNMIGFRVSSTICGHLFCEQCIEKALELRQACPKCNRNLTIHPLLTVYLT